MQLSSVYRFIPGLIISTLAITATSAQTVSSPYSIVGLGDLETRSIDKYSGMASASTALQSSYFLNTSNPASLSALNKHFTSYFK